MRENDMKYAISWHTNQINQLIKVGSGIPLSRFVVVVIHSLSVAVYIQV